MSYKGKNLAFFVILLSSMLAFTSCGREKVVETQGKESVSKVATSTIKELVSENMFRTRDKEVGYDESEGIAIVLENGNIQCSDSSVLIQDGQVTIKKGGTYFISGTRSNGQIQVDTSKTETVYLVFDNVTLNSNTSAPLYVKQADRVIVTLKEGTKNTLSHKKEWVNMDENSIDGVIFSKDDLVFNGMGELVIISSLGHGIVGKDDLVFMSGTYDIQSDLHGIVGKDSVRIASGTYTLKTKKDGIHSENKEDTSLGFLYIENGNFSFECEGDSIDASSNLQIEDGTFVVKTGGGSEKAEMKKEEMMPHRNGERPDSSDMGVDTDGTSSAARNHTHSSRNDIPNEQQTSQNTQTSVDTVSTEIKQYRQVSTSDTSNEKKVSQSTQTGTDDISSATKQLTHSITNDGAEQLPSEPSVEMKEDREESNISNTTSKELEQNSSTEQQTFQKKQTTETTTSTTENTVSQKGIKSGVSILIKNGTFTMDCYDDAIHCNDTIEIRGGTFDIKTGDDGIHADSKLNMKDGTVNISYCYEGMEAEQILMSGGNVTIISFDDGINAARGNDQTSVAGTTNIQRQDKVTQSGNGLIQITGGTVMISSEGDGIDANGSIEVSGGKIVVEGSVNGGNGAIDYDKEAKITGGTMIALGMSNMSQNFGTESTQGSILVDLEEINQKGEVVLQDTSGKEIIGYTPTKQYQSVLISSPEVKKGGNYQLLTGKIKTEIKMESLIYGEGHQGGIGGGKRPMNRGERPSGMKRPDRRESPNDGVEAKDNTGI